MAHVSFCGSWTTSAIYSGSRQTLTANSARVVTDNPGMIATDSADNLYIAGSFSGTVDFDPGIGVSNLTSFGIGGGGWMADAFVSKLDSGGNFVWAKNMGGADAFVLVTNFVVDKFVHLGGSFWGTAHFKWGQPTFNLTAPTDPAYGMFLATLDTNGTFVWAVAARGPESQFGFPLIAADAEACTPRASITKKRLST